MDLPTINRLSSNYPLLIYLLDALRQLQPPRPMPATTHRTFVMEYMNEDVFRQIAVELSLCNDGSLKSLASTSHFLRDLTIPVLFSRCLVYYNGALGIPPPSIRPFVRTITYYGPLSPDYPDPHAPELAYLPAVKSIIFGKGGVGIPWPIVQTCLAHPSITSISFTSWSPFKYIKAYPEEEVISMSIHLSHLSYRPDMWRGFTDPLDVLIRGPHERLVSWEEELEIESRSLSPIVLNMHNTAESLDLPMETTPLALMARRPWMRLQQFKLHGEIPDATQASVLPNLLLQMPQLVDLSIMVARTKDIGRLSVFGRSPSHDVKPFELRSLALAYPDPNDAIFDLAGSSLIRLCLSDRPRHYVQLVSHHVATRWWGRILSATECLGLLMRMTLPHLESLELVYQSDVREDSLLDHVVRSFPKLSNLELHRYRQRREEVVPYIHIARILASANTLRTVYLNLDFHDDHGPFCEDYDELFRCETLRNSRGWELEEIFRSCPALKFVALLSHSRDFVLWREYHSMRYAKSRIVDGPREPYIPRSFRG